jgi:hypothetical protein
MGRVRAGAVECLGLSALATSPLVLVGIDRDLVDLLLSMPGCHLLGVIDTDPEADTLGAPYLGDDRNWTMLRAKHAGLKALLAVDRVWTGQSGDPGGAGRLRFEPVALWSGLHRPEGRASPAGGRRGDCGEVTCGSNRPSRQPRWQLLHYRSWCPASRVRHARRPGLCWRARRHTSNQIGWRGRRHRSRRGRDI